MVLNDYVDVGPNSYNKEIKDTKLQMAFVNYTHENEFQKYIKEQREQPGPANYDIFDYVGKRDCQKYSMGKEKKFLKLAPMV